MSTNPFTASFETYMETSLIDRYLPLSKIEPLIKKSSEINKVSTIGHSFEGRPIYSIEIGNGPKKIMMWSQMHGNESTTTKAIFDIINHFSSEITLFEEILSSCTLMIVPMLNPDGAEVYTRVNANQVDLNRDAQALSQPESQVLHQLFVDFKPNYCFNLHGQRTIFSAGMTSNPATVSFLSPAQNEARSLTTTRKIAMEVIAVMNKMLQQEIPDQVGVYDDSFNINCVGDTFQTAQTPTILFEAGHYKNDYNRNITRKYIYASLLTAIDYISKTQISGKNYKTYLNIPQNEKCFLDIIIRNTASSQGEIGIQYQEVLKDQRIQFVPKIQKIGNLDSFFAHRTIDGQGFEVKIREMMAPKEGDEIDFVIINNEKYALKIENY